jgi:hypothetical protein
LNDEFTQIGLDNLIAGALQCRVEVDLLGRHAFRLDNGPGIFLLCEADNVVPSLLTIAGPEYGRAALAESVREFNQIGVEMVDRFPFDLSSLISSSLPILDDRGLALRDSRAI